MAVKKRATLAAKNERLAVKKSVTRWLNLNSIPDLAGVQFDLVELLSDAKNSGNVVEWLNWCFTPAPFFEAESDRLRIVRSGFGKGKVYADNRRNILHVARLKRIAYHGGVSGILSD